MYNFGDTSQHDTGRPNETSLAENLDHLGGARDFLHNIEDEMRPHERQGVNTGTTATAHGLPHASAFAPEFSPQSNLDDPRESSTTATASGGRKEKHKDNSKIQIAKEVLGLNKKDTSGMSPEEKERVLLEERWKRAMAEENRLNVLEERVKSREQETAAADLLPNFPPKILCIKPLVHHDLQRVPEIRRKFVRLNFINWIVTCVLLLLNMIVAIAVVAAPYKKDAKKIFKPAQNSVLAIVYLLGAPLSFIVWYWQIYSACSTGRQTKHILSLCGLIIALAFVIFMVVGRSNYAACGVDLTLDISETKNKLLVVPVIIVLGCWVTEGVWLCYCIVRQWMYYRLDANAQEEVRRQMHNVIGG
ncbi:secretory carrier membrane protein 3 [Trypanosoma conorhini]|uniref:Secretory carrier membrane protein 3 n=1 Tax=Trypanosoma conorhini TaxID=83891 RepID=A0A422MX16_9TRYP|nr:secretory carrier membrane protein 3 [Trypanosoma conorhini]RNE97765.1 secretory carrier membrane protein 3 [Trypanosoma conorhini]